MAQELSAEDYFNKIKESVNIQAKVDTKFIRNEEGKEQTITVEDLSKKKTVLYWKGCRNSKFKVAQNVTVVKIMIEDCHNCHITLLGPVTTSVVELWRSDDFTLHVDTEISTLQVDLCKNLTINYTHKKHLGSIVQAGIQKLRVNFLDYDNLSYDSGIEILKGEHKEKDINDTTDQFITRFIEGKLLTELILRDNKGMHTTERESDEFDEQKEKNDKATEERVRKMLKLAGPSIGLSEDSLALKSKEGKAEHEEKEKKTSQANLKKQAGNKLLTKGDFQKAAEKYTEAINITPDNHILYSNRCAAYHAMKDFEKALADADKCIELCTDFPKGHFRRGVVLLDMDKKDEALKSLLLARDLAPKDEEILKMLAKAQE